MKEEERGEEIRNAKYQNTKHCIIHSVGTHVHYSSTVLVGTGTRLPRTLNCTFTVA